MKLYVLPATKLLIVAIPLAKQVGATIIIVGAGGVINWKSIENANEFKEVQNPLELVTV